MKRRGFTLMELLVVLLIIGILSTVALRTIEATRDRGLFDQTTAEMNKLVHAIVGNPDLTFDGKRVDFGYFGDMETLPAEAYQLWDLVKNLDGSNSWHGPYFKIVGGAADSSFLFDGWGVRYSWNPSLGIIQTSGNGKYPMTVKVADTLTQLYNNTIVGTITDRDGAAPGDSTVNDLHVKLYYNNPEIHGGKAFVEVRPQAGGFYEISTNVLGIPSVPIGIHKLVAYTPVESIVRWVTIVPRSRTVVDFKFTSSFWNKIHMVGRPQVVTENDGFMIRIANGQATEAKISWLVFFKTPQNAWMRDFTADGDHGNYPVADGQPGTGIGDTVNFNEITIAPYDAQLIELGFYYFKDQELYPPGNPFDVRNDTFQFKFSDGSEITVYP